jgi:hypothetical protein
MYFVNAVKRLLDPASSSRRGDKYLFIICMNNSGSTLLQVPRIIRFLHCRSATADLD